MPFRVEESVGDGENGMVVRIMRWNVWEQERIVTNDTFALEIMMKVVVTLYNQTNVLRFCQKRIDYYTR